MCTLCFALCSMYREFAIMACDWWNRTSATRYTRTALALIVVAGAANTLASCLRLPASRVLKKNLMGGLMGVISVEHYEALKYIRESSPKDTLEASPLLPGSPPVHKLQNDQA